MDSNRMCDNSVCPATNITDTTTVKCHHCKKDFHLPCYEIIHSKARIFISKNIVFMCDECLECSSPKRKQAGESKTSNEKLTVSASLQSPERQHAQPPTIFTNKKLSEMIGEMIGELSMKIDNNTSTLSQIKNGVDSMHSTIRDNNNLDNNSTYANVLGAKPHLRTQFASEMQPAASSAPQKATTTREESRNLDAETKIALKKRQLTAGNSTKQGLGAPVAIEPRKTVKIQRTPLEKSVYVSRVDTSITTDVLIDYIKNELPNVDVKHFLPRLLVKKGQDLEELTFVSFRLQCTEELYAKFISPDFWPSHVMIGEFVEKPSDKRSKLGDFIVQKMNELSNDGLSDSTAAKAMDESSSSTSKNQSINASEPPPEI